MATGVLGAGLATGAERWFHGRRECARAGMRLFCFPYSGAGASIFREWPGALAPRVEVCPVQLPGRETRLSEGPLRRMAQLVPDLARALLPHLDKPFALFGHSLGALIAFELARRLRRDHRVAPMRLFVSGHRAPHLPDRDPRMHELPDAELAQRLRELQGTPEEVLQDAELRDLLFPILRADFELCETYLFEPDEPLDCPISALGGLEDEHVDRASVVAWRQHTRGGFDVRMFPGNHFFIQSSRRTVIEVIARSLWLP